MQSTPTQSTTSSVIAASAPATSPNPSPASSTTALIVVLLPIMAALGVLGWRQYRSVARRRRIAKLERLWNLKPIERRP